MFGFFKKKPQNHIKTAHDLLLTVGQELYDEIRMLEILQDSGSFQKRKKRRQLCIDRLKYLLKSAGIFDHYQLTKV